MQKRVCFFYIVCFALLLCGCGADQNMKKGDAFFAVGEYYDAATYYRKAYTQTPSKERALRGQRAMKMAECYRRLHFTSKAISAYNIAVKTKAADSLTYFYLGQLQMRNWPKTVSKPHNLPPNGKKKAPTR